MSTNDSNQEQKPNNPTEPLKPTEDSSPGFTTPPFSNSTESTKEEFKEKAEKVDFQKKIQEKMTSSTGMEDILKFIRENKEALITYLFLLAGLLFLVLGNFFLGSLIIGFTAGYHFSYEIVFYLRNLSHLFDRHEHLRFLVMTAVIVGFFLSIPGMFFGAIVAAVFKHVIYDKRE